MEFILIACAHFLALLSPGPDFFLILQTALRLPLRYAFSVCGGIAAANGVYLLIAVLSSDGVRNLPGLFSGLKYLGAIYLIYIGVMLLRAPMRPLMTEEPGTILYERNMKKQFLLGFMSGILNPKNVIFYLSLFTAMVSPATSLSLRCLYGLWMMSAVFFWDCGVALLIGHRKVKNRLGKGVFFVEKMSGAMLTVFGILLFAG
ncbi:MAG: LysE family translocator [Proteobacteria bacterium]|nr:LysE family translocator [Pseudomonadota bacterium]MBU1137622.1 LysE family translocator [Pseudomonadota bacterium]MBU1233840.1 LysE family translocator [Pseudomonadota bacterium]MBU1417637.1 LysE family translocator [Pseudomonadota bacterium]MBU1456178.1 LysE family translocator [Pseudomonadota bacterium]